jgi:hypothetical protein
VHISAFGDLNWNLANTEKSLEFSIPVKNITCKARVTGLLKTCRVNNLRVVSITGSKTEMNWMGKGSGWVVLR